MNQVVRRRICDAARVMNDLDADQVQQLIAGWERLFDGLTEAQQITEFEAIIQRRERAGLRSIEAPARITED